MNTRDAKAAIEGAGPTEPAAPITWWEAVDVVRPHVVHITTPRSSGTGFLLYRSRPGANAFVGIATARHVVATESWWLEPIRLTHFSSGRSVLLDQQSRAILFGANETDCALIIFALGDMPLPDQAIQLLGNPKGLPVGLDVGWLGFPAVADTDLCFFGGRISSAKERRYLVDGVAIHGVSGGPVFSVYTADPGIVPPTIVGLVTEYIPNRSTGEALPGLSVIQDLSDLLARIMREGAVEGKTQEPPCGTNVVQTTF